ncbi:acetolactate synthase [Tuwongella immobilis]|uniref:ACT domain-containing protein n=1 Tax=Tuwongella immobilis TaxID=692036 RepID=A0A6C2YMH0_9BACT|nr:acetolactate synthase [Tuwongella immobilis]VIP02112.1 Uncharacterized protein OS=Blastopirellula marina DSM 3645 GN=DSM3645_04630 PE=4 SV=1 [Tuwongella immobilis]VTS00422.1 Uncharacterized protein OS=Blastopirellula marina DSM 3645 GN=DSM3645_04630 PE=4 SV=1 [Tuwongella immobilis]
MSYGDGAETDYLTARGRDWPSVRQFNVFLANRVGGLLDTVRRFEQANLRIVSLSVINSADCAVIRMVFSDPERATEILESAGIAYTESDLLVVKMPDDPQPILQICKALLVGEINIHYTYPILIGVGPSGSTALALYVEDHEAACVTLMREGFTIFTDSDLID